MKIEYRSWNMINKAFAFLGLAAASLASTTSHAAILDYGLVFNVANVYVDPLRGAPIGSSLANPAFGRFTFDTATDTVTSFQFNFGFPLPSDFASNVNAMLGNHPPCDITCFINEINGNQWSLSDLGSDRAAVTLNFSGPAFTDSVNTTVFDGNSSNFRLFSESGTYSVTGPVPEPATWALMLLGFAGVGFAMRQRGAAALNSA